MSQNSPRAPPSRTASREHAKDNDNDDEDEPDDEIAREKRRIKALYYGWKDADKVDTPQTPTARLGRSISDEKRTTTTTPLVRRQDSGKKALSAALPMDISGWPELEGLFTCCICLDRYSNPKMLPCQHSFCEGCIEGLYDYARQQVKCPECRMCHHARDYDVFPTNLTLVRFLELHLSAIGDDPRKALMSPGQAQRCAVCEERAQLALCAHCDKMTCPDCREGHQAATKREVNRMVQQVKRGMVRLKEAEQCIERTSTNLEVNAAYCQG